MKIRINLIRIFSQHYILGKIFSLTWSLGEMLKLSICKPSTELWGLFGLVLKVKPWYSQLSTIRLLTLYRFMREIQRSGLKGDIVECGVWNGGSSAMMARAYKDGGGKNDRLFWLFDSFEGLPSPCEKDSETDTLIYFKGICKGDTEKVKHVFNKLSVPFDNVKIVKGWIKETLPKSNLGQVSLLHIDVDWYKSVEDSLEYIYDKVVIGGYIVVDDYFYLEGCKKAVSNFFKKRGLEDKIQIIKVDRSAVYFQKI